MLVPALPDVAIHCQTTTKVVSMLRQGRLCIPAKSWGHVYTYWAYLSFSVEIVSLCLQLNCELFPVSLCLENAWPKCYFTLLNTMRVIAWKAEFIWKRTTKRWFIWTKNKSRSIILEKKKKRFSCVTHCFTELYWLLQKPFDLRGPFCNAHV